MNSVPASGLRSTTEDQCQEPAGRTLHGLTTGTEVTLIAEGPDEEAAVKTLAQMLVKDIF